MAGHLGVMIAIWNSYISYRCRLETLTCRGHQSPRYWWPKEVDMSACIPITFVPTDLQLSCDNHLRGRCLRHGFLLVRIGVGITGVPSNAHIKHVRGQDDIQFSITWKATLMKEGDGTWTGLLCKRSFWSMLISCYGWKYEKQLGAKIGLDELRTIKEFQLQKTLIISSTDASIRSSNG